MNMAKMRRKAPIMGRRIAMIKSGSLILELPERLFSWALLVNTGGHIPFRLQYAVLLQFAQEIQMEFCK